MVNKSPSGAAMRRSIGLLQSPNILVYPCVLSGQLWPGPRPDFGPGLLLLLLVILSVFTRPRAQIILQVKR